MNVITSGKTRSSSNQPAFITPNGAAASFQLKAATTNLVFDVNGTAITIAADITKSSLTTATASNNTALVNDTTASGQEDTRLWGETEHKNKITVDNMGSAITALVGKYAAFKIGSEYFFAYVESTTVLSKCRRGYYYDSSLLPVNRSKFSDDDTITLMNIGWVFADQDMATIDVSYNIPTWSFTAPGTPVTGDYWYDEANKEWKRYDGATFIVINRTFIGQVVLDSTNCVAARCADFYAAYSNDNGLLIEVNTTEISRVSETQGFVNVAGNNYDFSHSLPSWNITTNLAGSADLYHSTEQASTLYYLYLKDTGAPVISDISPYYRNDLRGRYHPHNPWRCVGMAYNDGTSNIVQAGSTTDVQSNEHLFVNSNSDIHKGSVNTSIVYWTTAKQYTNGSALTYLHSTSSGDSWLVNEPGKYAATYFEHANNAFLPGIHIDNSGQDLTSTISDGLNVPGVLAAGSGSSGNSQSVSGTFDAKIGDIIRVMDGDTATFVNNIFRITKLKGKLS